jgi:hypothetical protein
MVSSAIWKTQVSFSITKQSKLHESEGRAQFAIDEKLTSVFFPNWTRIHTSYYYGCMYETRAK